MAEGGYRKPGSPSPVPMPGALSRRTDGGPADKDAMKLTGGGKYGETADLESLQSGAPMGGQSPDPGLQRFPGPGFGDPSARPGEPVTQGADAGDGAGTEALGLTDVDRGDLQAIIAQFPWLEWMVNQPGAMPSTREMIRRIKAEL